MQLMMTVLCAAAVGLLLNRLKVPGGMMIGAVIGAAALSVGLDRAYMPSEGKLVAQIIAGAFIGSGIKRSDIAEMRKVVQPAMIVFPSLLMVNIATGVLLWKVCGMDLPTAMMSATPGGMSDIPMIAADMGADPSLVLVLQFVRMVMGIALFPLMIRAVTRGDDQEAVQAARGKAKLPFHLGATLLTLAVATVCGLIGRASPLPSGTMAVATLGCILLSCLYPKAQLPKPLRMVAQLCSGAYVGAGITMAQLKQMSQLGLPIVILIGMYTMACFIIGFLLVKAGCFNRRAGMLAATPAGASDMALISADMGVQEPKLIVLQVMRLIVVVMFFPSILSAVIGLLGG